MLDIHVDRKLCYTTDGWAERTEVYVQLYQSLIESGLLAQLKGNQLKVFLALALQATILTEGGFFQHLSAQGLARPEDLGQISCYQSQQELGKQCGLHQETVSTCLAELEREHRLVDRRLTQGSDGRFSRSLFIIHAEHFVSPPRSHRSENFRTVDEHRSEEFRAVDDGCTEISGRRAEVSDAENPQEGSIVVVDVLSSKDPTTTNKQPHLENSATEQRIFETAFGDTVFGAFAAARGVTYRPTARDYDQLGQLLSAGYTEAEILTGVQTAVTGALARGEQPRTFGYCVPAIRKAPPAADAAVDASALVPLHAASPLPEALRAALTELGFIGGMIGARLRADDKRGAVVVGGAPRP